jgi:signal transduction histidine kinase
MSAGSRTLAGRLSIVQTSVTLLALVSVALATAYAVTGLLARRADRLTLDVAARVAAVMERLPPESTDPRWIANEAEEQRLPGMRIEVRTGDNRLLAAVGETFDLPPAQTGCAIRGPVRVCGARSLRFSVVAAAPHGSDDAARGYLFATLVALTLLAAAVVALAGRLVARRALRPLSDLARQVATIVPGQGVRLPQRTGLVEVDTFASHFDDVLMRFEAALERERRLAAQASHELRTPLTLARAEIEAVGSPGADPQSVGRALRAIDRLSELVEALLWFAKAETRLDVGSMEVVNLADIVRAEIAARQRALRGTIVQCELPEEALVRGDQRLLERVTANLLDNALKYGRGAPIGVHAAESGGSVALTIINDGKLPGEDQARLFEPFFRGNAGAKDGTGFGLGLSFARAVARAHSGDLIFDATKAERTAFVLNLPLVAWSETLESGIAT